MLMRKLPLIIAGSLFVLGVSGSVLAAERPDHFKGEPAETLVVALVNFKDHNDKLEAILKKDELSPTHLVQVHELTYTLENALDKIRSELDKLAETLEEIHVASELAAADDVRTKGSAYLEIAGEIIRDPRATSQANSGDGQ